MSDISKVPPDEYTEVDDNWRDAHSLPEKLVLMLKARDKLTALFQRAEAAGVDGLWLREIYMLRASMGDVFVRMAHDVMISTRTDHEYEMMELFAKRGVDIDADILDEYRSILKFIEDI